MNIIAEMHHRLSSKTRIRSLFKDVNIHDLEKILVRLKEVHTDKLKAKEEEEKQREKKLRKILEIQEKMESLGLTLSDLKVLEGERKVTVAGKKRRNVSKHTFEYETLSGDAIKWYGSTTGRLPKDFQEYLEKTGKKRIDCIVTS